MACDLPRAVPETSAVTKHDNGLDTEALGLLLSGVIAVGPKPSLEDRIYLPVRKQCVMCSIFNSAFIRGLAFGKTRKEAEDRYQAKWP